MSRLYFDESIRDKGQVIVGALISANEDLSSVTMEKWRPYHLGDYWPEYKSSGLHDKSAVTRYQRDTLNSVIRDCCKIGIVVCPISERSLLGAHCASLVIQLIETNLLDRGPHTLYLDQNIRISNDVRARLRSVGVSCLSEQDSVREIGIQISDLAAHYAGTRLMEQLGLVTKTVVYGDEHGYEEDTAIEIGFELWAEHRHSMFRDPNPTPADDEYPAYYKVEGYGLYVSRGCSVELHDAALMCFGMVYLGCTR